MTRPRLDPLPAEEWDDDVRRALSVLLPAERCNTEGAGPALSTLARHPALAKAFLSFSTYLTYRSTLPPRVRETAILRVAHCTGCAYEWTHHVRFAEDVGLTDDDIAAIRHGHATEWLDHAVIHAVDELAETSVLSDDTWAELGEHLDERQRMDLVFTIGGYRLLATAFNTFCVLPEQEI